MANFFQQMSMNRQIQRFWALVNGGEIDAGLQLFEKRLVPHGADVDKRVRATYHFLRWSYHNSLEDYNHLVSLAQDEPKDSQIVCSAQLAGRLYYETELAKAVNMRAQSAPTVPMGEAYSSESRVLATVGKEVLAVFKVSDTRHAQANARRVLGQLKGLETKVAGVESARAYLIIWALLQLRYYSELYHSAPLMMKSSTIDVNVCLRESIYRWGAQAMTRGQIPEAFKALASANDLRKRRQLSTEVLAELPLRWAMAGIDAQQEVAVINWLQQSSVVSILQRDAKSEVSRLLLLGLGQLSAKRYNHGRETLDSLLATSSADPVQSQARYLQGLSYLAETTTWSTSPATDDDSDMGVHFQAQWRALRSRLTEIVVELNRAAPTMHWQGSLLDGLIAYVDANVRLTIAQVEDFARACEFVPPGPGRTRLKAIEAVLLTRAKAIDEAIALVNAREYGQLRQIKNEVLDPLGDAVPAAVRAAVYMTLREDSIAYDPWSDLARISLSADSDPDTAALIAECQSQVQAVNRVQALARLCRRSVATDVEEFPSLAPLESNPTLSAMGAIALGLIHLHRGQWQEALDGLVGSADNDELEQDVRNWSQQARFYAAWQLGEMDACVAMAPREMFAKNPQRLKSLQVRRLLTAIARRSDTDVTVYLGAIMDEYGDTVIPGLIMRIVEYNSAEDASYFLTRMRHDSNAQEESSQQQTSQVDWWLAYYVGLTAARLGQYTSAAEAFTDFVIMPVPATVDQNAARRLVGQAKLFNMEADLAIVAESDDDLKVRWPAIRRDLAGKAAQIDETPELQAYGYLVYGLVAYLTADMFVENETISMLRHAQRVLKLERYASFLEQVVARFAWRQRILEDFWTGLQGGNFQQSRSIYVREIQPAYGERIPDPIRLGMLLVDWDSGDQDADELLRRLAILEYESAELNPETIAQVRNYIVNGERTRQFTLLVKQDAYDEIIEYVLDSDWAQSMQAPVAIALLHAFYRKKRHDDARQFAKNITDKPNLVTWVKDYGYLILGYLRFDNKEYEEAAQAFERISANNRNLLGKHDTDRYWAISHFSRGLQYLENEDKTKEAFDSFRRSLKLRGANVENVSLIPLFTYFGLQNLERQNGTQALQAFTLLKESLQDVDDSAAAIQGELLAEMGQLLCRSLMPDPEGGIPNGEEYLSILNSLMKSDQVFSPEKSALIERTLRILFIAQTLRRRRSLTSLRKIRAELLAQVTQLENLQPANGGQDPVLLVLQALILLRLTRPADPKGAHALLDQAKTLGLHSRAVEALFSELVAATASQAKADVALLNLFDAYLSTGSVPANLRDELNQDKKLGGLYRVGRNYVQSELRSPATVSPDQVIIARIKHLLTQTEGSNLDGSSVEQQELARKLQEFEASYQQLEESERQLVKALTRSIDLQPQ